MDRTGWAGVAAIGPRPHEDGLEDAVLGDRGREVTDRVLVERYTRQGDAWLLIAWNDPGDLLTLESIACAVPLSEIYAKVAFEPGAAEPPFQEH